MLWHASHRQARALLGAAPILILVMASCGAWSPAPTQHGESVTRQIGGWSFTEAADQASVTPPISQNDAARTAQEHLAEHHGAPGDLLPADALHRRGLVSIEGYGAGAQQVEQQDAWVVRFSSSSGDTNAWAVVGASGEVVASWYDGPVEVPEP